MKFDYSFLDLDYTIFDTRKFGDDIWAIFSSRGISRIDYEETYRESLCTVSKEEFDYNFQEHVDFLRARGCKLGQEVVRELNNLVNNDYLFPDSMDFIKFLKEVSEKVILLTAGDFKFQEEKIKHCGMAELFDEIVILKGHKNEYLRPFVEKNYKILFVNDSWRENIALRKKFDSLFMVGVDGPHGRKSNDGEVKNLIYLPSLTAIKNYVIGLK
ncbi:MAG: hypothetical protein A2921_01140 [Candidatus Magasanikbacteria bacterium RIFCSPLOWO2_01_FULL_43_20b]|uniref:Haloacid dehalogenase n=1 Tax=Candidatus Magasanikbacteria bacterium RIFCSPLOWO2_12_FULL_43_12 TaxID=1798692 RepID=A0A1F6MVD7_9BACT|nr:MAG: hypothetical protein A3I93_00265 [Candidatus Magasanikbacteria bacterium RIFCSPLOWO2_02_FULL_43_22]OGH72040.1 MAG: hypothetical protein A3C74_01225 [Candidatus Magasanikbacteria bacterium RIFCSPHIGHO2_02_FULL_44_13]OGH73002.1 MAG: hypothetical protein A2921_01140 [Candidatus Magasanikbacteria bacterium RIFCSPLOWO2_01_FULL_43_20b]OGH75571.1 MAG: hypothetical protein A3G00_00330 [Candidatus Magasanikbacteria bacterium RIFCSPLOWO2_12_FULL_43_12]